MASAAIAAGASVLGGILGGKGAAKAAKIQAQSYQQGLQQQQQQFNLERSDAMPFHDAGVSALSGMGGLLGFNGPDAQSAAIEQLKASPEFTSLFNTGADTVLQNASATGGLRGGNVQSSLANFGSGLLAQVIQNHLANLGGLASLGAGSTQALGALGQQNVNAQTNLMGQIGNANAVRAAAPYAAMASALQGVGQNSGGLASLFGGGGGGTLGSGGGGNFNPQIVMNALSGMGGGLGGGGPVFGYGAQGNPSGVLSLGGW